MKIFLTLILSLIFSLNIAFGSIAITKDYNSREIIQEIKLLKESYPKQVDIIKIGTSTLKKPIYAIRIFKGNSNLEARYEEGHISVLILGGLHGTEQVNPKLIIKQLEYYLENNMLNENIVIHAIPLGNPDGYDLVMGESNAVPIVNNSSFDKWKANINGVDLNRNFEDKHYDYIKQDWVNIWGRADKKPFVSREVSKIPSEAYYFGKKPNSESETKAIAEYMKKYYFDGFIDYHSQGQFIFWDTWYFKNKTRNRFYKIAKKIADNNDYRLEEPSDLHGSGYSTNYFSNLYYDRPALTVETTKTSNLPINTDSEEYSAFEKNKNTTITFIEGIQENIPYGNYKAYDKNLEFFNHFHDKKSAQAYAKKYDLYLFNYEGTPKGTCFWLLYSKCHIVVDNNYK